MAIGFDARTRTVKEDEFSTVPIELNIVSNRRSELDYVVTVSEGPSSAMVTALMDLTGGWDFAFGERGLCGIINVEEQLCRNKTALSQTTALINNDNTPEENETVTLVVSLRTVQDVRDQPLCLTDESNPTSYLCSHTIAIIDEDGQLPSCLCHVRYTCNMYTWDMTYNYCITNV